MPSVCSLMSWGLVLSAVVATAVAQDAPAFVPEVQPASGEGRAAIAGFVLAPELRATLWAAEPLVANPVSFCFDDQGRVYVAETFRLHHGVTDNRNHPRAWALDDLACRTVADRVAMYRRHLGAEFQSYGVCSDRVRRLVDDDGDGVADRATVFADGFRDVASGIGAGLLWDGGRLYYTCIPQLWLLRDDDGDGVADQRQALHDGFGVHTSLLGHDMHGLKRGPDGRLYFSIGDRGFHVQTGDGRVLSYPDTGAVLRCEMDGSHLEVFAYGLRNPQELAFDDFGDLFTGDNNSDGGDAARWVYVVDGGDSGWRMGYQGLPTRGPWNDEKLWYPHFRGQAAYIVPPIANVASGPSGLVHDPGVGLLAQRYRDCFFLCDFRGGPSNSGVHVLSVAPDGAGFELVRREWLVTGVLPTDVDIGPDGALYLSDWVQGWEETGKGRIYRITAAEPADDQIAAAKRSQRLLAEGMTQRDVPDLVGLLHDADQRVRLEAQWQLADRGEAAVPALLEAAASPDRRMARLHAIWGLGEIDRAQTRPGDDGVATAVQERVRAALRALLDDGDAEVRSQAAKVLGDIGDHGAGEPLIALLHDPSSRVRFFAADALGRLQDEAAQPALLAMLRWNAGEDPFLRHAGALALARIGDLDALRQAATDGDAAVRMAVLLAFRRLCRPEIAPFLHDDDPALAIEAARAIWDTPIVSGLEALAAELDAGGEKHASGAADPDAKATPAAMAAAQPIAEAPPRMMAAPPDAGATPQAGAAAEDDAGATPPSMAAAQSDAGATRQAPLPIPLAQRAIAAAHELGDAARLATFAANEREDADMRAAALQALGDWPGGTPLDPVIGVWRPVPPRPAAEAARALQPVLDHLLLDAPAAVREAAVAATAALHVDGAAPLLAKVVTDRGAGDGARVHALRTLASWQNGDLAALARQAAAADSSALRREAFRVSAKLDPRTAIEVIRGLLEIASIDEQRAALQVLSTSPLPEADDVLVTWLQRLRHGDVPPEVQLDLLEAADARRSPAVAAAVSAWQHSKPADDPLADWSETLAGGDPRAGKTLFEQHPAVACIRCHSIAGKGGDAGPDLNGVSKRLDPRAMLESMIAPGNRIAEGFGTIVVTMDDGRVVAGLLQSDDAHALVVKPPDVAPVTLDPAHVQSRSTPISAMPPMGAILSKHDIRDLIAYLRTL